MRRRALLASVGSVATVTSSGCLGFLDEGSDPSPRLGWVAVSNYTPEPRRFRVEIERDGSVVHESTHEVAGKTEGEVTGEVLECTWGDARGPYTLRGQVDGGGWVERAVEDAVAEKASIEGTPDCVIVDGVYGRDGSDGFAFEVQDWCEDVPGYDGGCSFANSTTAGRFDPPSRG